VNKASPSLVGFVKLVRDLGRVGQAVWDNKIEVLHGRYHFCVWISFI